MKLYYSPGACSMAPHIVAREAGHAFDLVKVDIPNKKTASGDDYWTSNASRVVTHRGRFPTDSQGFTAL
jgi:glutathione S-transferase